VYAVDSIKYKMLVDIAAAASLN